MADENVEEIPPGGGKKKLIVIVTVSVLIIAGAAVGVSMAIGGGNQPGADVAKTEPKQREAIYINLEPEFVVNFRDKNDRPKFLKAEMSVSTTEDDVEKAVERHMPAIRNSLVLLLSRQIYDDLVPHEGKEHLRAEALAEVQAVLEEQTGSPGVDDLYFSSFVMH